MSSLISQKDITKIHNLFKAFDKIEFMRVDGRMYNGEFHLIELSLTVIWEMIALLLCV